MKTRSGDRTGKWTRYVLALAAMVAAAGLVVAGGAREAKAAGNATYSFVGNPYTVTEGNSVTLTVNRASPTDLSAKVCYTVSGANPADTTVASGEVNAFDVSGNGTIVIPIGGNTTVEGSRSFSVTLTFTSCGGNGGTISGTNPATVTVLDDDGPQITGISPHSGPGAGGNTVVITGSGFTGTTCPANVKFGATSSTACTVNSNNQITATAPAGAGTVNVNVTNASQTTPNTAADDYTYSTGPVVTSINPTSGPVAGGTALTITGTGLNPGTVSVGGSVCNVTSNTATQIVCTTTAHASGAADVIVTVASIPSPNTVDDNFTYTGGATISTVFPASGPTSGGQTVTITGTNLTGATSVTFGGLGGTSINVAGGGGSLTVVTPASAAGTVNVTVTAPAGSPTAVSAYTFTAAPTVSSVSPSTCSTAGGSTITVTGTGFVLGAGNTTVAFGVLAGTSVNVTSSTTLTVVCPAQTGTVSVRVTTGAGTSPDTGNDDFTYAGTIPTISGVSPTAGPIAGGTTVTITGTNFLGATSVLFGSNLATNLNVLTSTTIVVTAPAASGLVAQTVNITVTTPSGSDATVGAADDYTYTGGPTVTLLNPATGPTTGNTFVTVTGTGFTPSGMTVTFGGTAATFAYNSTTSLTAVSPAHSAGTFDVIVTTPGGTSPNTVLDDFTYTGTSAPVITSISPTSGPVGTLVTVTGTGFLGSSVATVGGVSASFTVVNDTTITLTVPTTTPGGSVDIRVTNTGGTSPNVAADDFNNTSSPGATTTYTLYFRWTLIAWTGIDNLSVYNAVRGIETGTANPNTNDVSGQVTAIWYWDGASQSYKGFFVGFENVPGANDFTTMKRGISYWIAVASSTTSWTVLVGQ